MPQLTKDNPGREQRDATIAYLRLQGLNLREIAKKVNLHYSQVSRILQDDEIKEIIESTQRAMIEKVPEAAAQYADLLHSEDESMREKVGKTMLQMAGILPSHTVATFIQNIYQQNNAILDAGFIRQVGRFFAGPPDQVDEAEVVELLPDGVEVGTQCEPSASADSEES